MLTSGNCTATYATQCANVNNSTDIAALAAYLSNPLFATATLPASFTFSSPVVAPSTSATQLSQTISVTNSGPGILTITSRSLGDSTNFDVSASDCATVAAGLSCDIHVVLRPQSVGSFVTGLTLNGQGQGWASILASSVNPGAATLSGTGVPPLVLGSAGSFTATPNATSATRPVTITDNTGESLKMCFGVAPAPNAGISFPDDYSIDTASTAHYSASAFANRCTILTPSATMSTFTVPIIFAPTGTGPRDALLTVQRLDVNAVPQAPALSTLLEGNAGAVINFDNIAPFGTDQAPLYAEVDGDNVLPVAITISNTGNLNLNFAATTPFAISSNTLGVAADYTLAGTCLTTASLAQGSSCVLTVIFNPSALGPRDATLTVNSNATQSAAPISLTGLGVHGPRLAVLRNSAAFNSGDTVDFTSQLLGNTYPAQTLTLQNGGTIPGPVGSLAVQLPAPSSVPGYSVVASPPGCAALAAQAQCTLAITFVPTALQPYPGAFTIQTSAGGSPFVVNLAGIGTNVAPALSWRVADQTSTAVLTSLAFSPPVTQVGSPTASQSIRLFNDGPGSAQLNFFNVVGLGAGSFVVDLGTCSGISYLGEHSGCLLSVQFAPGTAGAKAASLQVASNGNGPFLLPMSGTASGGASQGVLSLTPTPVDFGDTRVGARSLPVEVTLSSTGNQAVTVSTMDASGPFAMQSKTCPNPPFVLEVGMQCVVTITFQPTASGSMSGALSVTTDAAPTELALSGSGEAAADVSGGGCSMVTADSLTDPTLWALAALALAALLYRQRARAAQDVAPRRRRERKP